MLKPEFYLTRVYFFSAAHRLWSKDLSDEENRRVYGKCGNPKGHGHDYRMEITVAGCADAATGRVMNPQALDAIVEAQILSRWDHRHLDRELPEFCDRMSTGENIVRIIWEKLNPLLSQGALFSVRVSETSRSFFEYKGAKEMSLPESRKEIKVRAVS